jgi:hypothetical protein
MGCYGNQLKSHNIPIPTPTLPLKGRENIVAFAEDWY